ncbi:MAG: hypothetical protein QHG99_09205 [Methanomicrobiales archaeon]|nr:hypothetical protein [Methanomicrobiales archaeon]
MKITADAQPFFQPITMNDYDNHTIGTFSATPVKGNSNVDGIRGSEILHGGTPWRTWRDKK